MPEVLKLEYASKILGVHLHKQAFYICTLLTAFRQQSHYHYPFYSRSLFCFFLFSKFLDIK